MEAKGMDPCQRQVRIGLSQKWLDALGEDNYRHLGNHHWLVVTGSWLDYDFPFSWECHRAPTDFHSIIFQDGVVDQPPTRGFLEGLETTETGSISC
jgi:hypothetical protein